MIGQMSITDEHKLIPVKTKMKVILNILRDEPSTAVILHDGKGKKMKIAGVITAEEIDAAVNDGKNPKKLKNKYEDNNKSVAQQIINALNTTYDDIDPNLNQV